MRLAHALRRVSLVSAAATVLCAGVVAIPAPVDAGPAEQTDCSVYALDDVQGSTGATSRPLQLIGVDDAHELFARDGKEPGAGVDVAVIDSGVTTANGLLEVQPGARFSKQSELGYYHGSAVAGLIAGHSRDDGKAVGIAPGARIIDVRVYDTATPSDSTETGVTTDGVVQGLRWVADHARDPGLDIRVVNVSLSVAATPALKSAVKAVRRQDVVVVAASGNRPTEETDPLFTQYQEPRSGEDAVKDVHPAGYLDDVVAVNATADGYVVDGAPVDITGEVLQNSATDVAVPTYGAVSLGINGSTCVLSQLATSWAAAEVSGVIALLMSWFPKETDEQIIARLKATADGTVEGDTVLTGAGMVQPVEAMTRPLSPDKKGRIDQSTPEDSDIPQAVAPDPVNDPLDLMRDRAVWWGLLGGAAIVLALMLRPILARRRR